MLNRPTRGRSSERGQVLILAIAFIAFFGLLTVAVLSYASATELQHVHTEATASNDSLAEGGAAWAAADAASPTYSCTSGGKGSLTMKGGAIVSYTVNNCNPGETGSGGGKPPGAYCEICLLNTGSTSNPVTQVLSMSGSSAIDVAGEIDANGSICTQTSSSPVTAGAINLLTGAKNANDKKCTPPSPPACFCTPTPAFTYTKSNSGSARGNATHPDAERHRSICLLQQQTPTQTLSPGVYSQISVTGPGVVSLSTGVYILTGPSVSPTVRASRPVGRSCFTLHVPPVLHHG